MYKVSKDYGRFRELLDQGYQLVCFADYKGLYEWQESRCIAKATRAEYSDSLYYYFVSLKDRHICTWSSRYPDRNLPIFEKTPEEQWKSVNLSFIDPDYSRNDEEDDFFSLNKCKL